MDWDFPDIPEGFNPLGEERVCVVPGKVGT